MLIFRVQYDWHRDAGDCITQPVRRYYSVFHFPTPIEIKVGGELMQTRPNAFIISKPMEPRWFHFTQDTNLNWIHADVKIAPLLDKYEIPVNQVFYPADASFLPGLFRKIRLEFLSHDPHREDLLDSYMTQMLIKLSRAVHNSDVQVKVDGGGSCQ